MGRSWPPDAGFDYSNLRLDLLGQALADRAKMPYPELLKAEVTEPLKMNETVVTLSPEQEKRFARGHDGQYHPAHSWNLDALAGAGAIRSTASDMLRYLEAQLHPAAVQPITGSTGAKSPSGTIASALRMSHEPRAHALPTMKVALAWLTDLRDPISNASRWLSFIPGDTIIARARAAHGNFQHRRKRKEISDRR